MDANPDFRDLLQCFCAEKVRFIVVGAYAVIFHAEPRWDARADGGRRSSWKLES